MAVSRRVATGLVLAVATLLTVVPFGNAKLSSACHRGGPGIKTLAENAVVRVYIDRSVPPTTDLVGCWKRTGREQELDQAYEDDYGSSSFGLVRLRGRFVAHYSESFESCKYDCPPTTETTFRSVEVTDVQSGEEHVAGVLERPAGNRLLLDARGAIAWPARTAPDRVDVRVRDGEGVRTVGAGQIDPRSLQLSSRGRLRWVSGGLARSLQLKHSASFLSALRGPVPLPGPDDGAGLPQVAVDSGGTAVAVWQGFRDGRALVQASLHTPGGFFARPVAVSGPGLSAESSMSPQVATGPPGAAIVVWQLADSETSTVQAAVRTAAGSFSVPVSLSLPGTVASDPHVAMDQTGGAVVVWEEKGGVRAVVRSAAGAFSAPLALSTTPASADVAMGARGDALVVWRRYGTSPTVQASVREAGGPFSAPVDLSADETGRGVPAGAIDADGNAIVVWQESVAGGSVVRASMRPSGGSFSAPTDLTAPAERASEPQVAMNADGDAVVAWRNDRDSRVEATVRPAGGVFSPPAVLSPLDRHALSQSAAIGAAGDAFVTWLSYNGVGYDLQGAQRPPGGAFGSVIDISLTGNPRDLPQTAIDSNGTAITVWLADTGVQAGGIGRLGTRIAVAALAGLRVTKGNRVSYALNQAATVRFVTQRVRSGRLVGSRCVKPTASNHGNQVCLRFVRLGRSFTRTRAAGVDRFRFRGGLVGKTLLPGRLRLIATPVVQGVTGTSAQVTLRIRRR